MTVKQFFKSTSFKCIITLLCILLVCGVFLTACYGLMEVTPEMKLQRALNKIYGEEVKTEAIVLDELECGFETATVIEAYKDERGDYLVKSKGTGGFAGTVTCWVLVDVEDNKISKISKVSIESSDGETFLNSINFLDKYPETPYTEGFVYSTDEGFITSGASRSSTAINNAVNGAVSFVNNLLTKGGKA